MKKITPGQDIILAELYLERERVQIIAQASVYVFFLYILIGLVGLIKNFFSISEFLLLMIMGVSILLIANYPYLKVIRKEVEYLKSLEPSKTSFLPKKVSKKRAKKTTKKVSKKKAVRKNSRK